MVAILQWILTCVSCPNQVPDGQIICAVCTSK